MWPRKKTMGKEQEYYKWGGGYDCTLNRCLFCSGDHLKQVWPYGFTVHVLSVLKAIKDCPHWTRCPFCSDDHQRIPTLNGCLICSGAIKTRRNRWNFFLKKINKIYLKNLHFKNLLKITFITQINKTKIYLFRNNHIRPGQHKTTCPGANLIELLNRKCLPESST